MDLVNRFVTSLANLVERRQSEDARFRANMEADFFHRAQRAVVPVGMEEVSCSQVQFSTTQGAVIVQITRSTSSSQSLSSCLAVCPSATL
jgi:hypothetical protein